MKIAELGPLLQKIERLRSVEGTRDIYEDVMARVEKANTPTMGQSVCSHVICMCNPKAWGDRYVDGMDYAQWGRFLSELEDVANACGQAIYENH